MQEVVLYLFANSKSWSAYCDEPRVALSAPSRFAAIDAAQKTILEIIGPEFKTLAIDEGALVDEPTDEIMHAWQLGKRARDWPISSEYLDIEAWPLQYSSTQPLMLVYYFHLDRGEMKQARAAIDKLLLLIRRYGLASASWGSNVLYEAAYVRAIQRSELDAAQILLALGTTGSSTTQERANLALEVALGRKDAAISRYETLRAIHSKKPISDNIQAEIDWLDSLFSGD